MLAKMLQDEMNRRGISIRKAAKQIGVAHTTIGRVLEGKQVDLDTVQSISKWLNINVSDAVNATDTDADLVTLISSVLQRNPPLRKELTEAAGKLNNGEIGLRDLEDILAFIAFRIKMSHK